MDDFEYVNKLVRADGILEEIKSGGPMAMIKYKTELMELASAVLKEAMHRQGVRRVQ